MFGMFGMFDIPSVTNNLKFSNHLANSEEAQDLGEYYCA